jgi:hypothetical protein
LIHWEPPACRPAALCLGLGVEGAVGALLLKSW